MQNNMAGREKADSKPPGTSLLLEPPRSGFSWSDVSSNTLLMPVSAESSSVSDTEEVDSFVGQKPYNAQTSYGQKGFQNVIVEQQQNQVSSSLSQLQQPLRARQALPNAPETSTMSNVPLHSATDLCIPNESFSESSVSSTSSFISSAETPTGMDHGSHQQFMSFAKGQDQSGAPVSLSYSPQNPYSSTEGLTPPSTSYYQPSAPPTQNYLDGRSLFIQPKIENQGLFANSDQSGMIPNQAVAPESVYKPVEPHWFYRKVIEQRDVWFPFSMLDSSNLEDALRKDPQNAVVATDGGRYDVYVGQRKKIAVFWNEDELLVRRCTWFYKSEGPQRFSPYEEDFASKLEEYYHMCSTTGRWQQRFELPGSEIVIMQSPHVILHYIPGNPAEYWPSVPEGKVIQRIVKRGLDEMIHIDDGEQLRIDHLVFVVHGIGSVCDLRFRTIAECVDGVREIANNLMKTHFKHALDSGQAGRVEFLPVSWHGALHETTGIDKHMQFITLQSIPKLRHFINDTVLDIFYYSSPVYCHTIIDTVGCQLNSLYELFISRNPNFQGKVSVAGHSLGSLILFDILAHQPLPGSEVQDEVKSPAMDECANAEIDNLNVPTFEASENSVNSVSVTIESIFENLGLQEYLNKFIDEKIDLEVLKIFTENEMKELGLPMGPRKKLLAYLKSLDDEKTNKKNEIVTEVEDAVSKQKPNYAQSSSSNQMECDTQRPFSSSLTSAPYITGSSGTGQPSVTYPRILFYPECFFAFGSPIAMFLSVRGIESISEDYKLPTCSSVFNIFHPFDPVAFRIETLIDPNFTAKPVLIPHHKGRKRLHIELRESLSRMGTDIKQKLIDSIRYTWNSISEFARAHTFPTAAVEEEVNKIVQEQMANESEDESIVSASDAHSEEDIQIGQLNGGRRIDYVLQEKPIESLNEYLFALTSHAVYWDSEDTVLMILREVYALENITPSVSVPKKLNLYNPALTPQISQSMAFTPNLTSTVDNSSESISPVALGCRHMSIPNNISNLQPLSASVSSAEAPAQMSSALNQPIGPPPLSGFVKKSVLSKR